MSTRHSFVSSSGLLPSSPTEGDSFVSSTHIHALAGSTIPSNAEQKLHKSKFPWRRNNKSFDAGVVIFLCTLLSLLFVGCLCFAFVGGKDEEPFNKVLDDIAVTEPGLVLIGENVDVDIDEPSLTVTWSLVNCGEGYLGGSQGIHRSNACGIPDTPLRIYVDNNPVPVASFDPSSIPLLRSSGTRRSIQSLTQFDSDHALDVPEARLYPFDTYSLSSTLHALNPTTNETVLIRKLVTVNAVFSFDIITTDAETYTLLSNGSQVQSHEVDIVVRRSSTMRLYAMLMWIASWMLTHVVIGQVVFAFKSKDSGSIYGYGIVNLVILFTIPQLRNSMPDAPGFDGILLDAIGFFPQMVTCGLCAVILLVLAAVKELDLQQAQLQETPPNLRIWTPEPSSPKPSMSDGWTSSDTLISASPITPRFRKFSGDFRPGLHTTENFALFDEHDQQEFSTPRSSMDTVNSDGHFSEITLSRPLSAA
ncbi:hypothetical protein EVG20_g5425 [Dentipellis fragilis]|uniref:Transmembrane protein n=1 Tax=Dentipellis fragilis TaxID=205917 RepID=A0A4Y9YTC3_9AGAM|nr:hypothetical protein EVG20_g5425 [Dentipellis fragilis]